MRALALVLLMLAGPAVAADIALPALYDVAGVGAGDRLNVREAPHEAAAVVGSLASDARAVEVVAIDPSGG